MGEQYTKIAKVAEDLPKSLYAEFGMSYNQLKSRFIDISAGMCINLLKPFHKIFF